MDYEVLENEIKTRLTTYLGNGVEVEIMPETQAQFTRPFVKNRVEVCYKSSDYERPQSVYTISQHESMQVELVLWARLRRGTNGIYDLKKKVTKSILGYDPTDCGKIYLKNFKPENFADNLWSWSMTIECKTLAVEDHTEPTEPALVESTAEITIQ